MEKKKYFFLSQFDKKIEAGDWLIDLVLSENIKKFCIWR
jgi:hypothetical protein